MAEEKGILARFAGKGVYPFQMAWMLLLPFRNLYLSPSKLASRLDLREDSVVLELGCGPGYFSPTIAKRLPRGRLYLADIQPEMIEKARARLQRRGLTNVELTVCDGKSLPYQNSMFDVVYLVTVLGEISEPELYANEMFRILKPGGIVSVSEQAGDPDSLCLSDVERLLIPAGFRPKNHFGKGRTYTANFERP